MKKKIIIKKMKTLIAILFAVFYLNTIQAQNTAQPDSISEKKHKVSATIEVDLGDDKVKQEGDTTKIRMGKKEIIIIESGRNTDVNVRKQEKCEKEDHNEFNGHWAGIDLGVNGFADEDYSMYGGNEFMELNQPKSLEVNINFWEYNIGLQKNRNNIGLVTGMGLSYNNYKFDNPYTIEKVDGIIEPVTLDADNYEKSKLTVTYLTIPLMMEFQIPVNDHSNKLFLSGGIEGSLNIGSHTKVKWDGKKEKERGGFNINPFQYAAVCRVGLKDISLYASYNLNPLFKDDKGPVLTPFTIGISFINF